MIKRQKPTDEMKQSGCKKKIDGTRVHCYKNNEKFDILNHTVITKTLIKRSDAHFIYREHFCPRPEGEINRGRKKNPTTMLP